MQRFQILDGLELYDQHAFYKEVHPETFFSNLLVTIMDGDRNFSSNIKPHLSKFDCKTHLVNGLQQAGTKRPVHSDGSLNDLRGKSVKV